jgi:hypothetical protein
MWLGIPPPEALSKAHPRSAMGSLNTRIAIGKVSAKLGIRLVQTSVAEGKATANALAFTDRE